MKIWELFLIAVSLSMDAFAISVCKGLSVRRVRLSHGVLAGLYFGGFQALMPLIGYFIGGRFSALIAQFDHWVVFGLLTLIGANMIRESFGDDEKTDPSFSPLVMLPLALATSIDALAVGVSFAFLPGVAIFSAVALIGATTFVLSFAGVKVGGVFGAKYRSKAELVGGIVLILMGIKILVEQLFFS